MKKLVKLSLLTTFLLSCFCTKAQVVSLPYFNDFETDTTGWRNNVSINNIAFWDWGTPNNLNDSSTFSGVNAWSAESYYSNNLINDCYLFSPIFDCSGFNSVDISFFFKNELGFGQEYVFVEFTKDGGQTWLVVQGLPWAGSNWGPYQNSLGHSAWTGISSLWTHASQTVIQVNNASSVQFRFNYSAFSTPFQQGAKFSIDDFSLKGSPSIDLNLSLNAPLSSIQRASNTITSDFYNLYLYNLGTDTIFNYHIGFSLDGIVLKDSIINKMIPPGDVQIEGLICDYLVPVNQFDLCVFASTLGDSLQNDTLCLKGYGIFSIEQLPYQNDFENTIFGWTPITEGNVNTNWEYGSPNFGQTNSAYSGAKAWDVNLNSPYTINSLCYLYTPMFDCSGTKRIDVSFKQNRNNSIQTFFRLEMSLDNGKNWTIVQDSSSFALNWNSVFLGWNFSSQNWISSEVKSLWVNNNAKVAFRFVFSNLNIYAQLLEGVSIDDFKIESTLPVNVSVVAFQPNLILGAQGTQSPPLKAIVQNRGVLPVSGFTVGYNVNGIINYLTSPSTTTLNTNDTLLVNLGSFTIPSNFNTLCAFVNLNTDTFPNDDTLCMSVFQNNQPTVALPYFNDFESGAMGWLDFGAQSDLSRWELGMPNYGITNTTHSGANAWDVNLNSSYTSNINRYLYTPYFDCANIDKIDLSFWFNCYVEHSWDGVRIDYTKDDGVNWNVLSASNGIESFGWYNFNSIFNTGLPGWTGYFFGWKKSYLKGIDVAGANRISFRYLFISDPNTNYDGYSLDDFSIQITPDTNLACVALFPSNPIISVDGTPLSGVEVVVQNVGAKDLNAYTIGLSVDGIPIFSLPQTTLIGAGQTLNFLMPSFNVSLNATTICGFVTVPGDTIHENDTTCFDIHVLHFSGLNYTQNFDSGAVDWYTVNYNTSPDGSTTKWELGTPAFGATSSAFSPPYAWDVNLNSPCLNNVFCDLYSPSFSVSNLSVNHFVSFMLNYKTEGGSDRLRLEYSTDMAATWNVLGVVNDPQSTNWYTYVTFGTPAWSGNSNGWIHCNYILKPNQLGSNMRFRFVYTSDGSVVSDGVSIDDFNFSAEFAQDLSLENFIVTKDTFMVGKLFPVNFNIANYGTQNVSAVNIGYNHNGVIGSFNQSITMIPNLIYTLWSPSLVTFPGKDVLKFYIDDSLEVNNWNDTITLVNYGFERASIPYSESFESTSMNGWFARTKNDQILWEQGVPNYGVTNSAHSGSKVWDVVLDSSYINNCSDTLYSPVFSTVGWSNLMLSFWINYNILYQQTSVKLQYRVNNSTNWASLDALIIQSGFDGFLSPNNYGWSGFSFGWQEVRANLDAAFQNKADLRFRFVFSNQFHIPLDGFSIDDFSISGSTSLLTIYGEKLFDIFPNPANDFLTIRAKNVDSNQLNCTLYSIDGKVVLDQKLLFSGESTLDISSLSSGMYLIQLQSRNGELSSYRFVKN
ncbi:MAG: T9SS type A sorting domain-containing protein [Bacteroidia bacterium]